MSYKSYSTQVNEHLAFLKSKGFDVLELKVDAGFIRCSENGESQGRGELVYKTGSRVLNNGLTGLQTWFRGLQGATDRFLTYGLGPQEGEIIEEQNTDVRATVSTTNKDMSSYEDAGRRAYGFWQHSSESGRSEYLERKRVGYYGIRFRAAEPYGAVAVIPMYDTVGRLWNYQLLNPDGTKRHPKNTRTEGLFHILGNLVDGQAIGIAESYVTSASCQELTGIPVVCAFCSQNLKAVAVAMRERHAKSPLIIFSDNDRHVEIKGLPNQGILKAQEAVNAAGKLSFLVEPDFGSLSDSKSRSDWNDLIREKGFEYARAQVHEKLKRIGVYGWIK
jgi:phage/plasmid primase-like uncharacterized protein